MLNILVKLQAKLGDTIMATSLLKEVKSQYSESQLVVIMGKGLTDLKFFMTYIDHIHDFSKKEYPGPIGNFELGRMIKKIGSMLILCW